MRITTILLVLALAGPLAAAAAVPLPDLPAPAPAAANPPPLPDQPASAADWRSARDLQQKAFGQPQLPAVPGSTGELLLGAAGLGQAATATGGIKGFDGSDYEALYGLLQRYRDELAGLGLDVEALEARVGDLERESRDLKDRLDKLLPVDGAKVHGRVVADLEDLHVMGPLALNFPGAYPALMDKTAGAGARYFTGHSDAALDLEITQGPVSGLLEFDGDYEWGSTVASTGFRQLYMELRLPVAAQFGLLDLDLSPLTLWRNEDEDPFEPEPFAARRQRVRDDLELKDDRWHVQAVRLSTDLDLFKVQTLKLESFVAMPASSLVVPASDSGPGSPAGPLTFLYRYPLSGDQLVAVDDVILVGWKAALPLGGGNELSYQGTNFSDVTGAQALNAWTPMDELVQTGGVKLGFKALFAYAEGGLSSYQAPTPTSETPAAPLNGSALTAELGLKGDWGRLRLFGRDVSAGFHAAGAQGRTQDRNYEFLGPLPTEQTNVGVNGLVGVGSELGGLIPVPPEDQWNTQLIPPGVMVRNAAGTVITSNGVFGHLLPYNFMDSMSPYGQATPNRQGFGADGIGRFWGGSVTVQGGVETAVEGTAPGGPAMTSLNDGVLPASAVPTAAFSFQQAHLGAKWRMDFAWPLTLQAGATYIQIGNGQNSPVEDAAGTAVPFSLSGLLEEAGLSLEPSGGTSLSLGLRHLQGQGVDDQQEVSLGGTATWDSLGAGFAWRIAPGVRMDLLWETLFANNPDFPEQSFNMENAYARLSETF